MILHVISQRHTPRLSYSALVSIDKAIMLHYVQILTLNCKH